MGRRPQDITMEPSLPPSQSPSARSSSNAFAITSLILGIVAIATSITIFLGAITGVLAIVFGLMHLQEVKDHGRASAWAGLATGALGFVLAGLMVVLVAHVARHGASRGELDSWMNKPAPNIVLTTIDGESIDLSALRGRRVLIDMWATWCGPCRSEIPDLKKLRASYGPDQLTIIGISDESAATVRKFVAEHDVNYPTVAAANLPAPFSEVNFLPTKFVIGSDGVIRRIRVGAGGAQDLHDLVEYVR